MKSYLWLDVVDVVVDVVVDAVGSVVGSDVVDVVGSVVGSDVVDVVGSVVAKVMFPVNATVLDQKRENWGCCDMVIILLKENIIFQREIVYLDQRSW